MMLLTSVGGSFPAHVLAARLRAEGIDVELHGALQTAYPLSVGELGRVDVYVPEAQLDDARYVLIAAEVDEALDPEPPAGDDDRAPFALKLLVGGLVVGAACYFARLF